jgi:hypothetical protein
VPAAAVDLLVQPGWWQSMVANMSALTRIHLIACFHISQGIHATDEARNCKRGRKFSRPESRVVIHFKPIKDHTRFAHTRLSSDLKCI